MPEPRIGAAYIRVSTDDQAEYSPESQLVEIRRYAASHGILVPDEFTFLDEGISGKTTQKRPAFNQMIGLAKQKPRPFDVLLLWKFSRFARNRQDSIVYKSMLRHDLGIEVVSVSEPVGDDKISILIEALIEAMDEYYSINLAEEVRRGMTQRARSGKPNTHAPLGYRMQNGIYVQDADTAPIVQKIYNDFLSGSPMLEIVRELRALGVRSIHGNTIDTRGVRYILKNPVYTGKIRWTPTGRVRRDFHHPDTLTVSGCHEPLIPEPVFEQVQALLLSNENRAVRHARADGQPFILKGLVKCSCCGATLTLMQSSCQDRRASRIQCSRYSKGLCPESHSVSLPSLTAAVARQLEKDFGALPFPIPPAKPREGSAASGANLRDRQIARERMKLQRVREAYESGADTLAEYQENKARLLRQIERLETQEAAARQQAAAPARADPCISAREVNALLCSFIRQIIFDRKNSRFLIQYFA